MRIGQAIGDAASRIPVVGPVARRLRERLRLARNAGPPLYGGRAATPAAYARWAGGAEPDAKELRRQRAAARRLGRRPLVSLVIPVYKVPLAFLERMLDSISAQTYPRWEACIACADTDPAAVRLLQERGRRDRRFRVRLLEHNAGISGNSNAALALARGEFVALLDHDDELSPFALFRMVEAINAEPEADFLYSDKDSIDERSTLRQHALFKPGWSPEMLWSVNYLTHFNVMRRSLVEDVGGFRSETDGAQDWDIFLRVCERARRIVRVPGVHYHWRIHAASTSTGVAAKPYVLDAQLRTLRDHAVRLGLPARVEPDADSGFRLHWSLDPATAVHVIVDATGLPAAAVDEAAARMRAALATANLEATATLVVDEAVARPAARACRPGMAVVACGEDGMTATVNRAVAGLPFSVAAIAFASGRVISTSSDWLPELTGWVTGHHEVGFASGLILDHGGQVVEAGLVVDRNGAGSPLFRGSPLRTWGWFGGPLWHRNCTAASPWLVAIRAESLAAAGGFDERKPWPEAFTGLCRAIHAAGRRGVVVPHARATLAAGPLPPPPAFDASLADDPYFHPAFCAAVPFALPDRRPQPRRRRLKPTLRRLTALPRRPRATATVNTYAADAFALAGIAACTADDLRAPQQHPERVGHGPGAGWCNWYLPAFENPFYGGVMTILRFADYLQRARGTRQRFVICGSSDPGGIQRRIAAAFPGLATAEVLPLDGPAARAAIPAADFAVSTLWTTAYELLAVRNVGLKFYFMQDFEPLFYPAGSTYAQAELTYRFGFHAIANTRTLRRIYEEEYGGTGCHFAPQIDPAVFHGTLDRPSTGPRKVFFYGRPGHPRNGFELAATALRQLKHRLGDRVEIVAAGAEWNPADYGLADAVRNLGLLGYAATADLYRSCHVGFVMMMTKHPSYLPFEFMACGGLVVSNHNPANTWFLADGKNCLLAAPSGPAIADRLAEAVCDYEALEPIRRAGHELVTRDHADWDREFAGVADFIERMTGAGAAPAAGRRGAA